MTAITIGTRKLQKVRGAYMLNIPIYAVRTIGLLTGDALRVVLNGGVLMIEKEHSPATSAELGGSTLAAGEQYTPNGEIADA